MVNQSGSALERRIYIAQGEEAVGSGEKTVISTVLGSCVAVCLRDPALAIGGMNHILVPDGIGIDARATGVGATAMERLINALMKKGADRSRLEAKVFGGASMVEGLSDIGQRNAAFVFDYLASESIPCLADSVGGKRARQIRFWPGTGRVQQRFVRNTDVPMPTSAARVQTNDVEML